MYVYLHLVQGVHESVLQGEMFAVNVVRIEQMVQRSDRLNFLDMNLDFCKMTETHIYGDDDGRVFPKREVECFSCSVLGQNSATLTSPSRLAGGVSGFGFRNSSTSH